MQFAMRCAWHGDLTSPAAVLASATGVLTIVFPAAPLPGFPRVLLASLLRPCFWTARLAFRLLTLDSLAWLLLRLRFALALARVALLRLRTFLLNRWRQFQFAIRPWC
jgi:hypothetical protein